ncbi:MAG TPA: large conductance mechanosensitive channel protein MscL [Kofleriaceae bacterium]|nr:large conductance mechanosensitive channel protein MscL [Kofleriaceae bacterium]
MSLWQEFKTFAVKGNVIDLAVAVVIGAAFSKIVTALVSEIVMPLVGKVMPTGDWIAYAPGGVRVGVVLGSIIDFMVVAVVLFIVVVKLVGGVRRYRETPVAPTTKACTECLEEIPLAARRCRACTSQQPA